MNKNRKPATLTLTTETLRTLDPKQLADIGGAMKPRNTVALGCRDTSANCSWNCTI